MITSTDTERFERIMKRHLVSNVWYSIILIWSLSFLAGFAYGEEQDGMMQELQKPVTCTTDSYQKVKNFLKTQHGEVGMFRYTTDVPSGVEIFINPTTGSSTILEYLPDNGTGITCIISEGKGAEINSNVLQFVQKGISTAISY